MQVDEEIVEGLLCIFEMISTSNYFKLNLKFPNHICSTRQSNKGHKL